MWPARPSLPQASLPQARLPPARPTGGRPPKPPASDSSDDPPEPPQKPPVIHPGGPEGLDQHQVHPPPEDNPSPPTGGVDAGYGPAGVVGQVFTEACDAPATNTFRDGFGRPLL